MHTFSRDRVAIRVSSFDAIPVTALHHSRALFVCLFDWPTRSNDVNAANHSLATLEGLAEAPLH